MMEKCPDAVKRDQVDAHAARKAVFGTLQHERGVLIIAFESEREQTQHKQVEDGEYALSFRIYFPWTAKEQVKR